MLQSGQTASTFTYSPTSAGSYSITVTVTDSLGATSASVFCCHLVTVAASPTVSVAPVGPFTMDVGQSQLFTATLSGGSGTIHYQWYVGAGRLALTVQVILLAASGLLIRLLVR